MSMRFPRIVSVIFLVFLACLLLFVYKPLKEQEAVLQRQMSSLLDDISTLQNNISMLERQMDSGRDTAISYLEAETNSDAELRLQEVALRVLENNDVQVSTFGTGGLAIDTKAKFATFEFETVMTIEQLFQVLLDLRTAPQKIAIGQMTIRPSRISENIPGETFVSSRMTIWTYWTEPS